MLVLGIETSCDETGIALYDSARGLLGHELHTQAAMHAHYGGVVPELASRDHIRRVLPLTERLLERTATRVDPIDGKVNRIDCIDAVAYTRGPGLAGALLVGAAIANGLALALDVPAIGVHHLEGHLLSPLLTQPDIEFPFVALLVSGGHTQLMQVHALGRYQLLGETVDDAAGEAFDKSAKLLGLSYPGGPALAKLAARGDATRFKLPRPKLGSSDLDFSFSGLKTAVMLLVKSQTLDEAARADVAASVQAAIVDVLVAKSLAAVDATGVRTLVIAGGVGANDELRARLAREAGAKGFQLCYPPLEFCTDNGAMIALCGALRLKAGVRTEAGAFSVAPRWPLETLEAP